MVKLREDLFPNLQNGIFGTRRENLNLWIDDAYEPLSESFHFKDDFIIFINSIRNAEDAELFIKMCWFYNISKTVEKSSYVKLIMMISIIEKIITKENTNKTG